MAKSFTLYYWPIPFRGQFIRWVLAFAGAEWDEPRADEVVEMMSQGVGLQPVPHMAPPFLVDHGDNVALSQMTAILAYLGDKFGLIPDDPGRAALTLKVIGDANDVLEDITRNGGARMWTKDEWGQFAVTRLERWMLIFEHLGRQHSMTPQGGHLLGTEEPSLADLVAGCLWFTMADKLPRIGALLEIKAPGVAALSHRMAKLPAIAALREDTDRRFGPVYCGGQIEASLRKVLD